MCAQVTVGRGWGSAPYEGGTGGRQEDGGKGEGERKREEEFWVGGDNFTQRRMRGLKRHDVPLA